MFQDGVRINEPFGDVVNWDLLPQSAIAGIQVIPGSNPLFGLNTLGGALAIYTKSGSAVSRWLARALWRLVRPPHPAGRARRRVGPLGLFRHRQRLQGPRLGRAQPEPRSSSSSARSATRPSATTLDISLTAADNRLEGTQTLPLSFLDDRRQAYTYPDINKNQLAMLTVKGSHFLTDETC